ncbi:hypothetical protein HID58_077366 [Brassica napus]|uniref:Uncharacterized protein n=1 Tax=Brassica napus TaxID=3708 RepID=A0ABQ7YRB0_BRANA|nr:hypothetical protein HID58_077366 [Brassica napus]
MSTLHRPVAQTNRKLLDNNRTYSHFKHPPMDSSQDYLPSSHRSLGRSVQQRLKTAYAPQRLCVFGIGGALTDKVFQLGAYQVECWSMVVMRSRFVLCQIHWFGCAAVVFDGSFSG